MATSQTTEQLSHERILLNSEQFALKTHLNLKEVMPTLIERKVIPARVGRALVKKNLIESFLGLLKKKPIEYFVVFMEAVAKTFPDDENHRTMVRLMSDSLKSIALPHDSDTYRRVIEITEAAAEEFQSCLPVVEPPCQQLQSAEQSPPSGYENPPEQMPSLHSTQGGDMCCTTEFESKPEPFPTQTTSTTPSDDQAVSRKVNTPDPMKPPDGYIQPTRSQYFTREDGGVFYCPAHDITICIPPNASPPDVSKFMINTRAYMEGPFKLPNDLEPCMPVVWVELSPSFTFEKPVTLKMPHCAVIDNDKEFCLLRGSKLPGSSMYEFTEVLEADFSDGYHVVSQFKHFCPITGGHTNGKPSKQRRVGSDGVHKRNSPACKTKTIKQVFLQGVTPDLVHQSSSTSSVASSSFNSPAHSFESSYDEHQSSNTQHAALEHDSPRFRLARQEAVDNPQGLLSTQQSSSESHVNCNKMCMTRCVRKQDMERWEVTFLVTCFHPTGILALCQACERIGGNSSSCHFQPTHHYLEFQPARWKEDGWSVEATQTPQICVEAVTHIHAISDDTAKTFINAGCYPPCLRYTVDGSGATNHLKCRIDITGADVNGREMFFELTLDNPALQSHLCLERQLQIWSKLFSEVSKISQALSGNLYLDPNEPDLQKLLVDISFQLTDSDLEQLPNLLEISESEVARIQYAHHADLTEQAYQMLRSWVASNYSNGTMTYMLSLLQKIGIFGIELCEVTKRLQNASHVEEESITDTMFIVMIGKKLGRSWRFVARFLGLSETTIDGIEYNNSQDLHEQSVQMLLHWQREKGDEATYGTLLRAIHRVWEHAPTMICGAWTCATQKIYFGTSAEYQ